MPPGRKRNCAVFAACDWLAVLTAHIPNAGEHLVRYYGWYRCIEQPEAIEKILTHLGVWPAHLHSPPVGVPVAISPATGLLAA